MNGFTAQPIILLHNYCIIGDGGIVVSMVAFQAVDPGSIPGHRMYVKRELMLKETDFKFC